MSGDEIKNISRWMDGQTIFITGSSGFVGKVLVYKLLKSCTSLKAIYLLLRAKRGKTSTERLEELFSSSMFDNMKIYDKETFKKVKMIEGDVSEKNLGISESDWEMLQNNVTIFVNAAASVRFDDSLKKAVFTNTRSAKYALLLAKGTKNLKAFVHVSTLYSNCNHQHIPEKVIRTGVDPDKMIKIAETFDEYQLEIFTQKILDDYPNTYIFTKNLAEELVHKERHNIPLVIYRPGVVLGSTKEPEPGWCDSFNSLSAFGAAGGKGILRIVHGTDRGTFLLINTDACVNGMLIAAWYRDVHLSANQTESIDDKIIFNVADFQFSLKFFVEWLHSIEYKACMTGQLWKGHCDIISSALMFKILTILLHLSRGALVDSILTFMGKKPRLIKIYRRTYTAFLNLKYFMSGRWTMDNDNFRKLAVITPQEEKKIFYTDSLFETPFDEMMLNLVFGVRKLLGHTPRPTKQDIKHTNRLYYIDLAVKIIFLRLFIYMLPLKDIWEWSVDKATEYHTAWNDLAENISVI